MRFSVFALLTLLAWSFHAQAGGEHFATLAVGGEVYSNVTVTSVTTTHVYFTHARGLGNARLEDLRPEMQRHFEFDPEKARAVETARHQASAQYRQELLQAEAARSAPAQTVSAPVQEPATPEIPAHTVYAKPFLSQRTPTLYVEKWLTPAPNIDGKFVLLDFWATWCGPCRQSIPHLNTLYARFKDRLVVIGLSNETELEVRRLKDPVLTYAVAIDTSARTSHAAEIRGIPHTILIDPQGIVRFEGHPSVLTEQNLGALLAKYSH